MSKFKVGGVVRIVAKKCDHQFNIGHEVVIHDVCDHDYWAKSRDGGAGWYVVDSEIEPVSTKTIKLGQKYKAANGGEWECIYISGDHAWMRSQNYNNPPAYIWKLDGESVSLNYKYDIRFEPIVTTHYHKIFAHGEERNTKYNVVDGKVDWSSLEIIPRD